MSNFSNQAAQLNSTPLNASNGALTSPTFSVQQELKRIDLSFIKADRSLSLHKGLKTIVTHDSIMAQITVIDLDQVFITDEATEALSRSYLTPAFLIDKFGSHYKKSIVAVATSGKLKGMKYINSHANEYVFATSDGIDIVVSGKCIEQDGKKTRQLHISCRSTKTEIAHKTTIETA